jgi:phosphoglycerate dehydrogenase-like enzyme
MIGEAELRAMKSTAFLINCGRGAHVIVPVLERALREGWIAGAGLDATDPEPLPADSPLRSMPNVIITPHLAGLTWGTRNRGAERFCRNIEHLLRGEALEGLVDREAGY